MFYGPNFYILPFVKVKGLKCLTNTPRTKFDIKFIGPSENIRTKGEPVVFYVCRVLRTPAQVPPPTKAPRLMATHSFRQYEEISILHLQIWAFCQFKNQ